MKIVGGIFKNKKLFIPIDKKTRPLRQIVKESIFNIIDHSKKINLNINGSNVLDLFSGSGSFGLECISRRAKKVFFFENYPNAIEILQKNLKSLKNIKNYEIIKDDCFRFFDSNEVFEFKFDLIFIDPPYKEIRVKELIAKIKSKKILAPNGVLIIHRHKNDLLKIYDELNLIEERTYGISKVYFGN